MSDPIRFVFDGRVREIRDLDPNTTVLEWLRAHERACGTKEGCAEGDCGACTVIVGTRDDQGVTHHHAINSCIRTIATLDGVSLTTVESLARDGAAMSAVQRAMVEEHGSQCGFCTPGFVMSLSALAATNTRHDRETILRALAGNLCRCTGYRPILAAAERALAEPAPSLPTPTWAHFSALDYRADGRSWHAPRSLAELDAALDARQAPIFIAGATDLGLEITKKLQRFDTLIALDRIAELQGIRESAGTIDFGSAVTWREAHAQLARHWPALDEFLARFAGQQIRNVATLGGNIANASPIGDGSPVFLALGARLVLWRAGKTREVPLDQFFLGYRKTALDRNEIIQRIQVPKPRAGGRFAAYKISKRFDSDISAVCACFHALSDASGRIVEARLAFGGMAAIPARAQRAEAAMIGQAWSRATIDAARDALAEDFQPIDDLRASASYRRDVARNLLLRWFLECAAPTIPMRVAATHG